jgi:hypothetical protein
MFFVIFFFFSFARSEDFCYAENEENCTGITNRLSSQDLANLSAILKDFSEVTVFFGSSMKETHDYINIGGATKKITVKNIETNTNYPLVKINLTNQIFTFNGVSLNFTTSDLTYDYMTMRNCKILNKKEVFPTEIDTDMFTYETLKENSVAILRINGYMSLFTFNADGAVSFSVGEKSYFVMTQGPFGLYNKFITSVDDIHINMSGEGGLPVRSRFVISCNKGAKITFDGDWSSQAMFYLNFASEMDVTIKNIPPHTVLRNEMECNVDLVLNEKDNQIYALVVLDRINLTLVGSAEFGITMVQLQGTGVVHAKRSIDSVVTDEWLNLSSLVCAPSSNVSLQSLNVTSLSVMPGTMIEAGNSKFDRKLVPTIRYDLAHLSKVTATNQEPSGIWLTYMPTGTVTENMSNFINVPYKFYCAKHWFCDEYLELEIFELKSEYSPFHDIVHKADNYKFECVKDGDYTCGQLTFTKASEIKLRVDTPTVFEFNNTDIGIVVATLTSSVAIIIVSFIIMKKCSS